VRFTCDTNVLVDVLRDPNAEAAFRVFLSRFSRLTCLSAVVILELRAGARTPKQGRVLETGVIRHFERTNRVFAPSVAAFKKAGSLLARLAVREGWTADAHPSLVHDALLAASCRESGVTLITRDRDFERFGSLLPGWRFVAPWPEISQ
jgi:predicted nucleic acid-binding protein